MKKLIIFASFGLFLAVPVLVFAENPIIEQLRPQIQALQAQLKSLQAQQSVAPPAPTSVSLQPPVFDDDTSDDDIIQLNNLRINGIARNGATVIDASYDFARCLKFSEESAAGITAPCPAPLDILYRIRVDDDTRMLLRNRQRATIKDFDIGDRINVFGFMDRDTRNVDALIIRNLDKPAVQRFIQLNNVEVVSVPPLPEAPASFYVVQKYGSPCFDYGATGGASAEAIPCPFGLEIGAPVAPDSSAPSQGATILPPYRKYLIEVTRDTVILQRDRAPMALKEIAVGDALNIYGVEKREAGIVRAVKALIVRDLSKPAKVGLGILRVTVTDAEIICAQYQKAPALIEEPIMPPCGIIYNAKVRLYDQNGNLVGVRTTSNGMALFENLREETYRAAVSAPGYQNYEDKAVVKPGGITFLTLSLAKVPQKITVYTKDDLRGAVGKYFSAAFLADGGSPSYDFSVTAGSLPPGLQLVNPPMPVFACYVDPVTGKQQCPEYKQTSIWLQGTPTQTGTYKFELMARDQRGNAGSATFVSVISPSATAGNLYISPENPTISVGKTIELSASYQPPCPTGLEVVCPMVLKPVVVSWSSSDPKIAALSPQTNSVIVTGVSAGKAVISASYIASDGTVYKGTTNVTVVEAIALSITVSSPNGGEGWQIGSTQTITWKSANIPSDHLLFTVRLRDDSGQEIDLLPGGTLNDGSEQIKVPELYKGSYWLEIKSVVNGQTVFDKSDAPFSIVAATPAVVTVSRNYLSPDGVRITGGAKGAQLFRFNVAAPADRSVTLISAALEFKGDGLRYLSNIQVVDGATDAVPYSLSGLSNVTSMGADQVTAGLGQLTVPAQGVKDIFVRADVSPFTSCSTCSLSVWVRLTGLAVDTSTNQFSIIGLPVEGHSVYLIPSSFSSASPATGLASVLEAIQAQLNSIAEKIRKLQR